MKTMIPVYWALLFFWSVLAVNAQSRLNFGLAAKQPESELPRSKAPFIPPVKQPYRSVPAELIRDDDGNYRFGAGWEMSEGWKLSGNGCSLWDVSRKDTSWYPAEVPGTVLTTLVRQGVYPDPYYGVNNLHIPDTLCRTDWWYRIAFDAPADMAGSGYELLLEGINYRAEVWFNGQRLGSLKGAFRRGIFPLFGDLWKKNDKNILAIRICPPPNPGIPHEQNEKGFGSNGGSLCLDGPTFISSEGWDWIPGIRDRNTGIWQEVKLVKAVDVKMIDPFVITDLPLPDTTCADITVKTRLANVTRQTRQVTLQGEIGQLTFSCPVTLGPGEQKEIVVTPAECGGLRFRNPRLWWPNGYGQPHLYDLRLRIHDGNRTLQVKNIRFGIRELSYELMARTGAGENIRFCYEPTGCDTGGKPLFDYKKPVRLEKPYSEIYIPVLEKDAEEQLTRLAGGSDNPYLVIRVNGQRIFCRGGNWGMDDGMKRVSRERLEPYMKLHKEAGFTMVRNWTGESTEELFYTLCDEYGLLVWNDFMMSTEGFNLEPLDYDLFLENMRDVVCRFRNHPSIAVWCPRNEGYAPAGMEDALQRIVRTYDGTRHYHGNSRHLNLCPSGPWGYYTNSLEFLTRKAGGFTTELGAPAVPTAETIRKFVPEEDLWPIGDVWYYHDMHIRSFDWKAYIRDVNRVGKQASRQVDEFAARAQFINYDLYRTMFETWNSRMWNDASGMLLWMSHSAWPSMTWQTYSYDYETPGSYFGAKKACEPVHIQWNYLTGRVQAANATLGALPEATAVFTVFNRHGKKITGTESRVAIAPDSVTECFRASLPEGCNELSLVRVELKDASGKRISVNDYWINPRDLHDYSLFGEMKNVRLNVTEGEKCVKNGRLCYEAEVTNRGKSVALGVKLNVRDAETHEAVLPAYVSDGYFNLLPGETRIIDVEIPAEKNRSSYLSARCLNPYTVAEQDRSKTLKNEISR